MKDQKSNLVLGPFTFGFSNPALSPVDCVVYQKKAKKRSERIRNLSLRKPASIIVCVLVSEGRAGFLERMRPPLVRTTGLS